MSGGNSLYESQDLLGAVGEAKASTQNQDAEARRPAGAEARPLSSSPLASWSAASFVPLSA